MMKTSSFDCSKSNSQRAKNASVKPAKQSRESRVQTLLPLVAAQNPKACQELLKLYGQDIRNIACRFTPYENSDERRADLESLGKQELLKLADAAANSGYTSGASSYLSRFLYIGMRKAANKTKVLYNVPETLIRTVKIVSKCLERFAQEYCTDALPDARWIANETGLSEEKVRDTLYYMHGNSCTASHTDEDWGNPIDCLETSNDTESMVYANELKAVIQNALGQQPERDRRIFLRKMGLSNDRTNWTSESIAEAEHMTVARVNQIVRKVQSDLRESITTIYRKAE